MKVAVLPLQPHCFAYGGFEIQMSDAFKAAQNQFLNIEKLNPWSKDAVFDILHLWGLDIANYNSVRWAKLSGKKVVLTALFPYFSAKHYMYYKLTGNFGVIKLRNIILSSVDRLVVVNELQAAAAIQLYGIKEEKIRIIPNIVANEFWSISDSKERIATFGLKEYILTTGNICRRKNQINLAKAAIAANLPLLIVGDVLPGEYDYANELSKIIDKHKNIKWIKGLPHLSEQLTSCYRNAKMFALTSLSEQQPISALEAAVSGLPLILSDRKYAEDKRYGNSLKVNPIDVHSISQGLIEVNNSPSRYTVKKENILDCLGDSVGLAYKKVYEEL